LSSRQFTPLAIYKFRSFNELDHEFSLRLSTIRPLANLYLSSYPRAKTALVSRFVAFLAGSFAAVLIVFSIIDPDAFLHFEVTPGRTVLFWIGILGGIVAVARGMTPAQEGEAVRARLEPGELMREIVELSRYCPEEWEGKLHAYSVSQVEPSGFEIAT
jgi:autophagy-related protein 9